MGQLIHARTRTSNMTRWRRKRCSSLYACTSSRCLFPAIFCFFFLANRITLGLHWIFLMLVGIFWLYHFNHNRFGERKVSRAKKYMLANTGKRRNNNNLNFANFECSPKWRAAEHSQRDRQERKKEKQKKWENEKLWTKGREKIRRQNVMGAKSKHMAMLKKNKPS